MWFYSLPRHDKLCLPAEKLYADYLGAVKYGNVFSLDVGPDYAGKLREVDVDTLRKAVAESGQTRETDFSPNQTALLSPPSTLLVNGIRLANQAVFQSSQEKEEYRGMGTTVVALYFFDSSSVVAHVGDSRLYRIRGRKIDQLTEDHSLVSSPLSEDHSLVSSPLFVRLGFFNSNCDVRRLLGDSIFRIVPQKFLRGYRQL
jgi:serine/threonine protein phosphatase PrpC